jgi:hypothetical protein
MMSEADHITLRSVIAVNGIWTLNHKPIYRHVSKSTFFVQMLIMISQMKASHLFKCKLHTNIINYLILHVKIRNFDTNVNTILLYGSETWRTTKSPCKRLQVFINRGLCPILKLQWSDKTYGKGQSSGRENKN